MGSFFLRSPFALRLPCGIDIFSVLGHFRRKTSRSRRRHPFGEGGMLQQFFGLKDNPFKQTFDPAYLFMGRHHEEAMAHLRYAVAEGEGFTVITGVHGVGKSTVCRAFAESLKGAAAFAFLSSPIDGPRDLLQRMNRSFGISADPAAYRELIHALNGFLMRQRMAARKVAVFIDDAQTLSAEALEQVRLISNLETTREKLIQIVLIGEPELMQLLNSHKLRQMGQRVSVCYEIGALTADETAAYLQHRLSVASTGPPVRFRREAVRHIFRHARGNPRRINIACSSILSEAYKMRQKEVTGELAQAVIRDLDRLEAKGVAGSGRWRRPAWALASAGLLLFGAAAFFAIRPSPAPPAPARVVAELPPLPAAALAAEASPPPQEAEPSRPVTPVAVPLPPPAPAPKPVLPAASKPAAMTHSVQVGAYLYLENAQQVAAQLNAKGYSARILKVTDAKGRLWHTVRIGDHPSRQAAQAQAEGFRRREQQQSVVRPFGTF